MKYQDQIHFQHQPQPYLNPIHSLCAQQMEEEAKTLAVDSNFQLCKQIKGMKNVKVGKKGEYRLLQENIETLQYSHLSTRRFHSSTNYQQVQPSAIKLSAMKKMKISKKISKKTSKIPSRTKNISQHLTAEDKSSSFAEQFQNVCQNSCPVNDLIKIRSKGITFQGNKLKGSIGYSTLIFSHQITEGSYYLEFKIVPFYPLPGESQYIYKPEIRIGVCGTSHKLDTPLGFQKSIGFHLSKKIIITEGRCEELSQISSNIFEKEITSGDIVGLLLDFSPPHRNPDSQKNWSDSSLTFFLNGEFLGKYTNLKQMFYHPALSLYNGACLEFHMKEQQMIYKPQNAMGYEAIKQYINIYN